MENTIETLTPYVMYLVVNNSLNMSPGKIAAQVGHAVMELSEKKAMYDLRLALNFPESILGHNKSQYKEELEKVIPYNTWRVNCRKVVLKANSSQWRKLRPIADVLIIDAGYTEIEPNSETVLGFWPMRKAEAPKLIKKLQVL